MTERYSSSEPKLAVEIPERGLVIAFNKSRREAQRLSMVTKILKDAVVDRAESLSSQFEQFIDEAFVDTEVRLHNLPGRSKESESTQVKILDLPDGQQKRIKLSRRFEKKYIKDRQKMELVEVAKTAKIDDPNSKLSKDYIYINFGTGLFDMRDGTAHQTLLHGNHHLDPISANLEPEAHADIIDVFTDTLQVLKSALGKSVVSEDSQSSGPTL